MAEFVSSPGNSGRKPRVKRMPIRVDLTAMVDLAFLLITFFMLTTTLAKKLEMPVIMPADGPQGPVPESRSMTICLGKNDHVMWYLGLENKPLIAPTVNKRRGRCA